VADAVVSGRSAEPLLDPFAAPATRSPQLASFGAVQRKVFVNNKLAAVAKNAEQQNLDPSVHEIAEKTAELGQGNRNILTITLDGPRRYFEDEQELEDYAQRRTADIGFVDRQKCWIRLPRYFVLGERHGGTILYVARSQLTRFFGASPPPNVPADSVFRCRRTGSLRISRRRCAISRLAGLTRRTTRGLLGKRAAQTARCGHTRNFRRTKGDSYA
jgi:hypothetical protein